MNFSPHLALAKKYWKEHLNPGDVVIDATCGNGHDTLYLCELKANVFSFDIQDAAIEKAKKLIQGIDHVHLFKKSHALIDEILFPKPPRLIVYNLGYLPGGDKSITTHTQTTLKSIALSVGLVASDGAISITCYPGHDEGACEEEAIVDFLSTLSKEWIICFHRHLNRPRSPTLIWMTKVP